MPRLLRLATVVLALAALAGCAGRDEGSRGFPQAADSQQWRLGALEARALAQRDAQQALAARVDDLERRVGALESGPGPVSEPLLDAAPGQGLARPAAPEQAPSAAAPASAAAPEQAPPAPAPGQAWEAHPGLAPRAP
ncbi:MAG: hypothetical protein M0P34_14000, partial [Desulfocurvus sp.]|nr:hypothetical protein [Desulfocurvus sp.]